VAIPDLCIHNVFEKQVARVPDAVAVICDDHHVTYASLDRAANVWARRLRAAQIGPETLVGLWGRRSPQLIGAMLGILKAGGVYVPLDASYPAERLAYMVEHSAIAHVLATTDVAVPPWLAAACRVHGVDGTCVSEAREDAKFRRESNVAPANTAAVIYTSGSAGRPKGVALSHHAIVSRLADGPRYYNATRPTCQKASFSVVAHIGDLFIPLASGAPVILVGDEELVEPSAFARSVERHGVKRVVSVPSLLRALLESDEAVRCLQGVDTLILSGEGVAPDLLNAAQRRLPGATIQNGFGCTETCGAVTTTTLSDARDIHAGTAAPGRTVHVLNVSMDPIQAGEMGHVYVQSQQLASGYLRQPALTADHFVPNPFGDAGDRLFRTGDLGTCRADGSLQLRGRVDFEVKIRGYRVNLQDVELALEQNRSVARAVVAEGLGESIGTLTAFVELSGGTARATGLREYLRARLPPFMVPARVEVVDTWPLLPNGKIDRQAVKMHQWQPVPRRASDDARVTNVESFLSGVWGELLSTPDVAMSDDFFDLGGDSLVATRLFAQISNNYDLELTLRDLLDHPTLNELVGVIRQRAQSSCD
jgi:amino acid adenylation domain-containing protein